MRILYLIPDFKRGGAERYLTDLCTEMSRHTEIEFCIGVLFDINQFTVETNSFKIINLSYETFSIFRRNYNIKLENLLKSFNPDIIHANLFLAEFISAYYPDPSIKYICHCHDNIEQFRKFSFTDIFSKKRIGQLYEKHFLISRKNKKVKTYFIANSNHTLNYFRRILPGFLYKNVRQMNYGFNFARFRCDEPRIYDRTKPVRILNVGSFQEKKNQILLLETAKILDSMNIPFEMNLIGDGNLKGLIKSKIEEYNLHDKVYIRGIISDVEHWYNNSDIYMHTAYYEPFGLVFLEAMASRLPVISLNGKGNADLIINNKTGFLIEEQKPELFAERVNFLINNPNEYNEISNNCYELSKGFDIEDHAITMIGFYNEIMNDGSEQN